MRTLIQLLLISFSSVCLAQNSGTIYYIKTVNDSVFPLQKNINYKILFKDEKSLQITLPKSDLKSDDNFIDAGDNTSSKNMVIPNLDGSIEFLHKDYKGNKLLYTDYIFIKYFYINDTLDNFKWTLTTIKEKIIGYDCTKATTSFRGRNYTAWFAEEIPLRFGPWKFGGLPGLIIKLEDSQKHYVYELSGLDLTPLAKNIEITIPVQYQDKIPQSYQKFREYLNKKLEDFERQSRVVLIDGNAKIQNEIKLPPKMEKY